MLSEAFVAHLTRGPFPNRVDPWAESGHYFQQIHAGMIGQLIEQMQPQLTRMGYRVGREASLQIAEGREPDVFVQRAMSGVQPEIQWDYALAAAEVLAQVGVEMASPPTTQAIHIRSGRLVTVIELISPGNKDRVDDIQHYRARRERLITDKAVNVVEIDLSRSIKRMVQDKIAVRYPYHVAVYLPAQPPRFVGVAFEAALGHIAIPLQGEVIPVHLHTAYAAAYEVVTIAGQINDDGRYTEAHLPFPSTLTDAQIEQALTAVAAWQAELDRHKAG